jgi:hypothetical protein
LLAVPAAALALDWQPVSAEDLQMTREPRAPTAGAIYLYRQVDRDDANSQELVYVRVKILNEEGRKRGNVEIPYIKDQENIRDLRARPIHRDGTIIDFDGAVYEKPLLKASNVAVMSKSFALPDVEIGSIIEYRYRRMMPYGWVFDSKWLVSDDLFTKHAVFSLKPSPDFSLRWSAPNGLPSDSRGPTREGGVLRLETHDVPAFVTEEFMPPEDAMKYRVEFIYEGDGTSQTEPDAYWNAFGKSLRARLAHFVKDERALAQEAERVVAPADSTEEKVRKLYARVQRIRNLTFERQRSPEEIKRDGLRENHDAADVLDHGYAVADDIVWTLYGLLRAAKLDASIVFVAPRDEYLFDRRLMNARQLARCVVLVNLDDSAVFLDPGTPFMPFALLPWSETAITGLRLTERGETWINTSLPSPAESRVARKATVKLTSSGSLEGVLTVTCTGLEAAWRRVVARDEDETARRRFLEQEVEAAVPAGLDVKLTNAPDWASAEAPLVAQFDVSIPGWVTTAGNRALLPTGIFGGVERHVFEHSARVHPIYFRYLYQHTDEIAIELPAGWQISSVPPERASNVKIASYSASAQAVGGTLNIRRELVLNTIFVAPRFYDTIHGFYQAVRAGDEDQVVVGAGLASSPPVRH